MVTDIFANASLSYDPGIKADFQTDIQVDGALLRNSKAAVGDEVCFTVERSLGHFNPRVTV